MNALSTPVSPTRVHRFSPVGAGRVEDMNRLQRSFYVRRFKPRFLANDPVDVDGQDGYGLVLLQELLAQSEDSPDLVGSRLQLLEHAYPGSPAAIAARSYQRDLQLLRGEWMRAYEEATPRAALSMLLGLAPELGHPRVDPVHVFMWNGGRNTKTAFRELDAVIDKLLQDLDAFHDVHGVSLIEDFWNRLAAEVSVSEVVASVRDDVGADLDDNDIARSVENAREIGLYYEPTTGGQGELQRKIPVPRPWPRPEVFGRVWQSFLKQLVRVAENDARVRAGLPAVGEGLVAEVRLLHELRAAFADEVIHHQVRPTWLAPQSLDIVFADRGLAVEYQGEQHSRPVEHFGGAAAFERQVRRDANKRTLCAENGVRLLEVHPDYVLADVAQQIRDILACSSTTDDLRVKACAGAEE